MYCISETTYQWKESAGKQSCTCILDLSNRGVSVFVWALLKSQPSTGSLTARFLTFDALKADDIFKSLCFSLPSPTLHIFCLSLTSFPSHSSAPIFTLPTIHPTALTSFTAEMVTFTSSLQLLPLSRPLLFFPVLPPRTPSCSQI